MVKVIFSKMLVSLILIFSFISCDKVDPEVTLAGGNIGGDYYVATWGNDLDLGSFDLPWATWQRAFEMAQAGDTVYFRGGVWKPKEHAFSNSVTIISPVQAPVIGHSGEPGNPICYFNYPGETPVLDCSLLDLSDNKFNSGIAISWASFLHFRGLTVRNVNQPQSGELASGVGADASSNITFENMVVHDIGGRGMTYWGINGYYGVEYDTVRWINCDVYNCVDLLSEVPGNGSDGWKFDNEAGGYFYLEGCRAWNNGDDGFDVSGPGKTVFKNCWSFNHRFEGALDGNGFKFGANRGAGAVIGPSGEVVIGTRVPGVLKEVTNCISANNLGFGFYELGYSPYYPNNTRAYNNFVYSCGIGIQMEINYDYSEPLSHWRNTIIYGTTEIDAGLRPYNLVVDSPYIESNNTWDYADDKVVGSLMWWIPTDTVTVTDDDFESLDVSQLSLPRKADGSLPDITFGKLVAGSDLIDMGVDVGLHYNGSAPDIGAFEHQ